MYSNRSPLAVVKRQLYLGGLISSLPICLQTNSSSMTLIAEPVSIGPLQEILLIETEIQQDGPYQFVTTSAVWASIDAVGSFPPCVIP